MRNDMSAFLPINTKLAALYTRHSTCAGDIYIQKTCLSYISFYILKDILYSSKYIVCKPPYFAHMLL